MQTLEDLVGAQLVVGVPGTSLTPETAAHLRAIRAGGFIPFERNWDSPAQFRALVAQVAKAVGRAPVVMVDHEGGRVIRFRHGCTQFPSAREIGRTGRPEAAQRQGAVEARELRALGVHMNLAPCVDVLAEGSDPVIGDRSYGTDAAQVAQCGAARICGLQEGGVAACAKHFPGLGTVPNDPHKQLPTVTCEPDRLRTVDWVPFAAAIAAGVTAVMSSHVCYPKLETPGLPATFSRRLIHDLLRTELGFQGLIVTDDLEMGALQQLCSIGEAAVRAVEVGHDLVLVCHQPEAQREVFEALCGAYRSGRLIDRALEATAVRLTALAEKTSA